MIEFIPENILRREAENYLKLIKDKRAMGEADHPEVLYCSNK